MLPFFDPFAVDGAVQELAERLGVHRALLRVEHLLLGAVEQRAIDVDAIEKSRVVVSVHRDAVTDAHLAVAQADRRLQARDLRLRDRGTRSQPRPCARSASSPGGRRGTHDRRASCAACRGRTGGTCTSRLLAANRVRHAQCDFGVRHAFRRRSRRSLSRRGPRRCLRVVEQVDDAHLPDAGCVARGSERCDCQCRDDCAADAAYCCGAHLTDFLRAAIKRSPAECRAQKAAQYIDRLQIPTRH